MVWCWPQIPASQWDTLEWACHRWRETGPTEQNHGYASNNSSFHVVVFSSTWYCSPGLTHQTLFHARLSKILIIIVSTKTWITNSSMMVFFLEDKSMKWVSMSSYYGNILASRGSGLHHTESRLLVTIEIPRSRKRLCPQCLHREKGFWAGEERREHSHASTGRPCWP